MINISSMKSIEKKKSRTQGFSRGFTYYQINTLDSRISNIDQLLTQDVEKFCTSVADLYTNISKVDLPIVFRKTHSSL